MKRALITATTVCGLLATAWMAPWVGFGTSAQAGDVKSLRGDLGISDTNTPPVATEVETTDRIPRNFPQQPPIIPHTTGDFSITSSGNDCLQCHVESDVGPRVSPNHFIDRNGNKSEQVTRGRWFCTQCHVPQENAKPLIPNTFKGAK